MLAFIYSSADADLSGVVKLFHDYPPAEVRGEDMDTQFKEFFKESDRQLITVHDETH